MYNKEKEQKKHQTFKKVEDYLEKHLDPKTYRMIHIINEKPVQANIWYIEDKLYMDYPLPKEEENKLFQCFKQMKSLGIIDYHEEYHSWKRAYGYPVNHANYYDAYNSWLKDNKEWRFKPGILFEDLYK